MEPRSWDAQVGRKVHGTNRLGAKESRLETTTSVWKPDENPEVEVKKMFGRHEPGQRLILPQVKFILLGARLRRSFTDTSSNPRDA